MSSGLHQFFSRMVGMRFFETAGIVIALALLGLGAFFLVFGYIARRRYGRKIKKGGYSIADLNDLTKQKGV